MASAVTNAAIFAVGAICGGGIATVIARQRRKPDLLPVLTAQAAPAGSGTVVQFSQGGQLQVQNLILSSVLKYGNPGPIADTIVRKAYVAAYDRRLRHPAWTAEHLTLASLGKSALEPPVDPSEAGDRTKSSFIEDESIPLPFRAKLQDYFRSGYDRGHMVPAADAKFSQEAMNETFLLSNIAPQVGDGFNRHYWAYLEDWCRRLTGSFKDVYVFTVPLYLPRLEPDGKWRVSYEVIGSPPSIGVPTHFAKVVLASRPSSPATPDVLEISTGAFVLPNAPILDETPLESFVAPVEAVERAAGLNLFSDPIKAASKHICKTTKCQVIVRRFDDAQKKPNMRRAISAPPKT